MALAVACGSPRVETTFGYAGGDAPDRWGELDEAYATCGRGHFQSPIDLHAAARVDPLPITIAYQPARLRVVDNEHTVRVDHDAPSYLALGARRFRLVQYHFHSPSEHAIEGERHALELHLVHQDDGGDLAVLAVFLDEGEDNSATATIMDHLPTVTGAERSFRDVFVDPARLLPSGRAGYRYFGSLTTPPCTERVYWTVLEEPVHLSAAHIEAFRQHYRANARPLQPRPDWCLWPADADAPQ